MSTRIAKSLLGFVLLGAVVATAYSFAVKLDSHEILSVRIAGEFNHVSERRLQSAVNELLPASFLRVDVARVRDAAIALPWVKEATVRRVWPDSLHIAVIERAALARWGEHELIEADGTRFALEGEPPDALTLTLHGPPASEQEVLARYHEFKPTFQGVCGGISALMLDARGMWRATLGCGPELVLGKQPGVEALHALAQALLEVFGARAADIERIDLRYANGFAVRWKQPVDSEFAG